MKASKKTFLMILLVVSMVLCCGFSIRQTISIRKHDFAEKNSLILDSVYETVENELSKPIVTSLSMANDVFLKDFLLEETAYSETAFTAKVSRYLSVLKEEIGAQTAFLVSEASKKYYTDAGFNKIVDPANDDHDVWYSVFANSRKAYDLDVDLDQVHSNLWTVFVNTRIADQNGKLLGVCGIGLSMEKLQEILKYYEEKYDVDVHFVDADGIVQVGTDTVNIESSLLYDVQYSKEKDGYSYYTSDGTYIIMRFVENLNWYLVIQGNRPAFQPKDSLPTIFSTILVMVINLAAVWLATKDNCRKSA